MPFNRIHRMRPIWPLMVFVVAFWIIAPHINRDLLFELIQAWIFCGALAVALAFASSWVPALFRPAPDPQDQYLLAFGLAAVSTGAIGLLMLLWRVFDLDWLLDSLWRAFFLSIGVVAWMMFLTVPGALRPDVPPLRAVVAGGVIGGALALGITLFLFFGNGRLHP